MLEEYTKPPRKAKIRWQMWYDPDRYRYIEAFRDSMVHGEMISTLNDVLGAWLKKNQSEEFAKAQQKMEESKNEQ